MMHSMTIFMLESTGTEIHTHNSYVYSHQYPETQYSRWGEVRTWGLRNFAFNHEFPECFQLS